LSSFQRSTVCCRSSSRKPTRCWRPTGRVR
jgi:hypothetical protein